MSKTVRFLDVVDYIRKHILHWVNMDRLIPSKGPERIHFLLLTPAWKHIIHCNFTESSFTKNSNEMFTKIVLHSLF